MPEVLTWYPGHRLLIYLIKVRVVSVTCALQLFLSAVNHPLNSVVDLL
jgi:hypothetical protein